MFTGIIEGQGSIISIARSGPAARLEIEAGFDLSRTGIGDSIAVNGACLTAVSLDGRRFTVDVSPETARRTTLAGLRPGDKVNLERALRLSDRLDGHLVTGHVDGIGTLVEKRTQANAVICRFRVGAGLARYMIVKGSVAVDGISLTINACDSGGFQVSIIPHTARITTIGQKQVGDAVNIETDIIGKYVEKFTAAGRAASGGNKGTIDLNLLAQKGFLT